MVTRVTLVSLLCAILSTDTYTASVVEKKNVGCSCYSQCSASVQEKAHFCVSVSSCPSLHGKEALWHIFICLSLLSP